MKEFKSGKHVAIIIRLLGGRSGGAERIYCELANLLIEGGYRVTCLHFDVEDTPSFYPISSKAERINLFGPVKTKKQRRARRLMRLPFISAESRNRALWDKTNDFFLSQLRDYFQLVKPDVAISLMPPANTPTLLAAAGTDVKVVATNHNVPAEDYGSLYRWDPNPEDRRLRLKALDNAAAIHVIFPSFGEWFPLNLRERVVAIPNYVPPEFAAHSPTAVKEKLILAVGRLAPVKNYMQLIRSWSKIASDFPEWKVAIIGSGPQYRELENEIDVLGLQNSVVLEGHKSNLGEEYSKASIFCHPALFEGFGLSPAEALFLGIPVVSYADCLGVNQFVEDGFNGLAVARHGENDELASALRTLIENEPLRKSLGANGPASVSMFTWDRYRDNWIHLIEKLSGEPR